MVGKRFGSSADGRLQTLPMLEPLRDSMHSDMVASKKGLQEQGEELSAKYAVLYPEQASGTEESSTHGGSVMTVMAAEPAAKRPEIATDVAQQTQNDHKDQKQDASYGFKTGAWTFDTNVADNWMNEVTGHIPHYLKVISLCAELSLRCHGSSARILCYWCSNGNQFAQYLIRGWSADNLVGMNYSKPLTAMLTERFPDIRCHLVDDTSRPFDANVAAAEGGQFATIQMLWALHFEKVEDRPKVLRQTFDSLLPGGLFLLAEKTTQPAVLEGLYHDYKRAQGVEESTIQAKKKAIVGVLDTLPPQWYEEALRAAGFVDVSIVHALNGFVTWMARKPAAVDPSVVVADPQCPSTERSDVRHLFDKPPNTPVPY